MSIIPTLVVLWSMPWYRSLHRFNRTIDVNEIQLGILDMRIVAAVLKRYLAIQPEPLLPFDLVAQAYGISRTLPRNAPFIHSLTLEYANAHAQLNLDARATISSSSSHPRPFPPSRAAFFVAC